MSDVITHIVAAVEPNKTLNERAESIVQLSKSLENIPVETKKSWADLADEEIDHAQVASPTIVSDSITEENVKALIDVIATVWIESETQSLEIKLDLDLVSESCAKLFIKIRKTYPSIPWPVVKAFIFVEHFQPFEPEVQEDLKQLYATMEESKVFDDDTLTEEQKQKIETMASLKGEEKTELLRQITLLACRKIVSAHVYEKINDDLLVDISWDLRFRHIATLFLSLGNSAISIMNTHEKIFIHHTINLSNEVLHTNSQKVGKRILVQFTMLTRVAVRMANTDDLIPRVLAPLKGFFDELRDLVLEPKLTKLDLYLVLAYLDILYHLALKRGTHVLLSKNTNVMDFLFGCLKNESPRVQKGALLAIAPILEGSPMTAFIGKNRCNALIKQIEVHMHKTWLINSGALIRIIGLLSTEFNEGLKLLNVLGKYAPILSNRYDGKEVQLDLLQCLQKMTFGPVNNPNVIEGITMAHSAPGVFDNIIRIVHQAQPGTKVHATAFKVLAQLTIPNTPIIEKIHASGVQKDVRRVLLTEEEPHLEAVYFISQLVQATFEQAKIDDMIKDFYAPILELLNTAEDVTFLAYALISLSMLARCKDEVDVKQVITCATTRTKDNDTVLDILTQPSFLFSPDRNIRCAVFKVLSSLSTVPSTANLLVDYGLVPPLAQVILFDTDACFQQMPCSPQYHALTALNNMLVFNEAVKQTVRTTPLLLSTLQLDEEYGNPHPIIRATTTLVANVTRDNRLASQWQQKRAEMFKREKEFLAKNPQYRIKNTVKKEILMPDDLFSTNKPKGPECSNPVCPNKAKRDLKIMNCAVCGKVGYCSKECQKIMWPIHKNYCQKG